MEKNKKTIQLKIYLNGTQSEKSIKRNVEYLITCGKKKITSTLKKSQQAKTNFFSKSAYCANNTRKIM